MAVLFEGGLAVVAVVLGWLLDVPLGVELHSPQSTIPATIFQGVVATLPLLALFWCLVRSRHPALQRLRRQVEWVVGELFGGAGIVPLALVAVLAGVGEELLFRGVLLPVITRWTMPLVGLLASSLLFGLAHALSVVYFLLTTLVGVYFAWLTLRYGLPVAMLAHGLYDFVALVYLSRRRRRPFAA